jgi:hypothetical protein
MNNEKRDRILNAVATAQAMLDRVVAELEPEETDGRVQSVHGERDVGADAGRRQDPDRRQRDTSRGGGSVAHLVVGRADTEAGAGGPGVAGRGAGGSPHDLPAAARGLTEGARYRVVDGWHDGKEGILVPGSIDESGFGKVYADIAIRDGGSLRCRAEDLERVDG